MPIFEITDPQGRTLEIEGDTPPTEAELNQIFASIGAEPAPAIAPAPAAPAPFGAMAPVAPAQPIAPEAAQAMGAAPQEILEPAAAIASSIIAEPLAGLAGLATLPFDDAEQAEQNIQAVREALTFVPRTPEGMKALRRVAEVVQPVGETIEAIETGLGDLVFEATDSPALAAGATALPAATMEALGFGIGRRAARVKAGVPQPPKKVPTPKQVSEKQITKALVESAPDISNIKDASRAIYKEIDDLNVTVKPAALGNLVNKVTKRAGRVNPTLTPKSAEVVRLLKSELDDPRPRSLSDFDELRQMAQIAAQSPDAADARIGAMMIDEVDEFLDTLPQNALTGPDIKTVGNVGERYKAARGLWGRARRAEVISDIFEKAGRQATGFENGIRTQLRQLLNNKKRARYFSKSELSAMDDVVKGTNTQNTLKLIGRLGFSEGAATNVLGGLVGLGVLGPAAPVAGQLSRKVAQKVTEGAARRMETLIRTGADGRKIAQAYLQSVPKNKRNAFELSDLLLSSGADVDELLTASKQITKEAAEIARARKIFERAEAVGAAVPAVGVATQQEQQ
jgi:hypothetical protein